MIIPYQNPNKGQPPGGPVWRVMFVFIHASSVLMGQKGTHCSGQGGKVAAALKTSSNVIMVRVHHSPVSGLIRSDQLNSCTPEANHENGTVQNLASPQRGEAFSHEWSHQTGIIRSLPFREVISHFNPITIAARAICLPGCAVGALKGCPSVHSNQLPWCNSATQRSGVGEASGSLGCFVVECAPLLACRLYSCVSSLCCFTAL